MYDVQNMVRVRTEPVGEKNSGIERRVGLNISDEDEELRIEWVVELKKELMYYNACNFPSIILYA